MEQRLVREGMYYASKLGMNNGDYAFIAFELDPVLVQRTAAKPALWFRGVFPGTKSLSKQEEKDFYETYKSMLLMVFNTQQIAKYEKFTVAMKHKMSEPPFCSDVYQGHTTFGNLSILNFIRAVCNSTIVERQTIMLRRAENMRRHWHKETVCGPI